MHRSRRESSSTRVTFPFSQSPNTTTSGNLETQSQQFSTQVKPLAPLGTLTAFSTPASARLRESICPSVMTRREKSRHWSMPNRMGMVSRSHHSLFLSRSLSKSVLRYFTNRRMWFPS